MELVSMGEKIKSARMEKRLTLERFSEMVGISRNFLWEIEAGRKAPAIQTLYNISKELGISADYLLGVAESTKWLEDRDEIYSKIDVMVNKLDKNELKTLSVMLNGYLENKN